MLAASALVVFSPVLAADALWILVETGRPILFAHPRVGKDGRVFRMYKFRTMVQNAVELNRQLGITDDPYGFVPDDPRITRSGRFLRRTSLDELPQLFNVVRGEMSLVGPRADIVEQVANYSEADKRRLAVKPGITGWAQVNGRDSIPWPKRFELDRVVRRQLDVRPRLEDRRHDGAAALRRSSRAGRRRDEHRARQGAALTRSMSVKRLLVRAEAHPSPSSTATLRARAR